MRSLAWIKGAVKKPTKQRPKIDQILFFPNCLGAATSAGMAAATVDPFVFLHMHSASMSDNAIQPIIE